MALEAVGAASSIAALLELTYKVLDYLKDVRDAGEERESYYSEASTLCGLLSTLQLRARVEWNGRENTDPWFAEVRKLQHGPLEQYRTALGSFAQKVTPRVGSHHELVQRLKWAFIKKDVKDLLAKVERLMGIVSIALQMDHFTLSQALQGAMNDMQDDIRAIRADGENLKFDLAKQTAISLYIQQDTSQIGDLRTKFMSEADAKRRVEASQRKIRIMEWLSDHDYSEEQHQHISQFVEGTGGRGLLSNPNYLEWEDGRCDSLLCVGVPGAGKTVTSATVIRRLNEAARRLDIDIAVAFLYLRYDRRHTQSSSDQLLGSLTRQLIDQARTVPDNIDEAFGNESPPSRSTVELFLAAVKCFNHVYFVVDALDESAELKVMKDLFSTIRPDNLRRLLELHKLPWTRVQLLATSRFSVRIHDQLFDEVPPVQVVINGSDLDIQHYATSRLSELPSCVGRSVELQHEVVRAIVASTQGVFLHAKLNMDSLKNRRSVKAIKTTIHNFSSGSANSYDTSYDLAMGRIAAQSEDDYILAQKVLTWLVHSIRPLSEVELETALAVEPGERTLDSDNIIPITDLLSLCAGLVTVDEQARTVGLVHRTTQEYFLRNPQKLLHNPHRALADICVSFLTLEDFRSWGSANSQQNRLTPHVHHSKFLTYAAVHYEDHVSAALPSDDNRGLELDLRLLRDQQLMDFFLTPRLRTHGRGSPERLVYGRKTGIQYAAGKGSCRNVSALLEEGYDKNDTSFDTTPLIEASALLHEPVVKLLIDAGADVNLRRNHRDGACPMLAALGMHIPKMYEIGGTGRSDVFDRAKKHARASIVALLLAAGADPNYTAKFDSESSGRTETALMFTARSGMKGVVAALCRAGADVHRRDPETGKTALHLAAEQGHAAVVARLLKYGCDPDTADNSNLTPACYATAKSRWAVVDLLLGTAKVDVNRVMPGNATIFTAACGDEKRPPSVLCPESFIERWLQLRPDGVNVRGVRNQTPLMCAVAAVRPMVVKVLVEAGADVHLTDQYDNTVLHIVTRLDDGHDSEAKVLAIMRLLHQGNVNIDAQDRDGATALMIAAEAGERGLQRLLLLLEMGANLLLEDNNGYTALTFAAGTGHKGLVTNLLHSNTIAEDDLACMIAAGRGHLHVLQLLISAGVDVDIAAEDGTTAVMSAIQNGHFEVVKMLVESGAQVNARMIDGTTPLMLAATRNFPEMIRLLLDAGALVNLSTAKGETALTCALGYWVPRTTSVEEAHGCLRMLLEAGSGVDALTEDGDTLLMLASKNAEMDSRMLERLLEAGADPNQCDSHGLTALMHAAISLQASKTKVLLEAGASPSAISNNGESTLILAIKSFGGLRVAKELFNVGPNANQENSNGQTALVHVQYSTTDGLHEVAEELVMVAAKVAAFSKDNTLVVPAARFSSMSNSVILKLLLAAGAYPHGSDNDGRNTIMLVAMLSDDLGHGVLQMLLDAGVDPHKRDQNGENALILAARSNHSPLTFQVLLDAGVDVHARNINGMTTLMAFASNSTEGGDRIRALIEAGVSIDAVDEAGNTALLYAAENGHSVEALLGAGADPNHANKQGETALMKTFSRAINLPQKVRTLLDAGANVNMVDSHGRNALIWATSKAWSRVPSLNKAVKPILGTAGVALDHVDGDGNTALVYSERMGNAPVAEMIRARLVRPKS